jgi:succinate dehydrogenase / fumarate reductase, flavoprotein subunit
MYEKITGISAYGEPMRISPAAHFSMGGLWVDYETRFRIICPMKSRAGRWTQIIPRLPPAEEVALEQLQCLLSIQGILPADYFHKTLGRILYDRCGLSRSRVGL